MCVLFIAQNNNNARIFCHYLNIEYKKLLKINMFLKFYKFVVNYLTAEI